MRLEFNTKLYSLWNCRLEIIKSLFINFTLFFLQALNKNILRRVFSIKPYTFVTMNLKKKLVILISEKGKRESIVIAG